MNMSKFLNWLSPAISLSSRSVSYKRLTFYVAYNARHSWYDNGSAAEIPGSKFTFYFQNNNEKNKGSF